MRTFIKLFGRLTLILLILSLGIYTGVWLEENRIHKINGSLKNSTRIALVNLDEGVAYQGEQRNFANEILGSYSDNYFMTGLEDAKAGIADGRYAAYIILPSDFSASIATINYEPQKSLLKYEISGNLSQEATDKAWQNVILLKEKLNDDIGYVYISSILEEFHNGQDEVSKLLANDRRDKEVLMGISNLDLVAALNLTEVERIQNTIEALDIAPDFMVNEGIIENIDLAYKGYLNETASQLAALKAKVPVIKEQEIIVKEEVEAIQTIFNTDGTANYSLDTMRGKIEVYNDEMTSSLRNLHSAIDEIGDNSFASTEQSKAQISTAATTVIAAADAAYHDALDKLRTSLKRDILDQELQTNYDSYINTYQMVEALLEEYNALVERYNEIVSKYADNDHIAAYLLSKIIAFLPSYDLTQTDVSYENFLLFADSMIATDESFKNALYSYAVNSGLTEEEAAGYTASMFLNSYSSFYPDDTGEYLPLSVEEVYSDLEKALKSDLEKKKEDLCVRYNYHVRPFEEQDLRDTLESEINKLEIAVSRILPTDIQGISDMAASLEEQGNIEDSILADAVKTDLMPLEQKQRATKEFLLREINEHNLMSGELHADLVMYDPLQLIDQNEIQVYVDEFVQNNASTRFKVEEKNREYLQFVSDSYRNADEHIYAMRDDVQKYQKESDEKVIAGLENAKAVREETSYENQVLMDDYLSKLPYTRNGTVANTSVYDFVTSPVRMEGEKAENSVAQDSVNYPLIFGVLAGSCGAIWGVLHIFSKRKKKAEKEM